MPGVYAAGDEFATLTHDFRQNGFAIFSTTLLLLLSAGNRRRSEPSVSDPIALARLRRRAGPRPTTVSASAIRLLSRPGSKKQVPDSSSREDRVCSTTASMNRDWPDIYVCISPRSNSNTSPRTTYTSGIPSSPPAFEVARTSVDGVDRTV
jgi:hypothetical protein